MCDFCKCWIADNKPSIQFHESGKRHKENVAKRLAEIGKKSAADNASRLDMEKDFKKMEQAAMKAYLKDMEGNADADLTAQRVKFEAEERKKEEAAAKAKDAKAKAREAKAVQVAQAALEQKKRQDEEKRSAALMKSLKAKWYEAKSEQGLTYYWHIETNESVWDPPEEIYLTIEEQKIVEGDEKKEAEKKTKEKEKEKKAKEESETVEQKRKALADAEEFFKKKKKSKPEKPAAVMGPAPKAEAYGRWKTVEKKVVEPVDWQLPVQPIKEVYKAPTVIESKPKTLFQEKTFTSLPIYDDEDLTEDVKPSASITFKKKSSFRGNARQRLDTDD